MEFVFFVAAHLTMCFIGPLVAIVTSYAMVFHRIWSRQIPSDENVVETVTTATSRRLLHQSKMRALRMLAAVVISFAISFLPLYVTFMRMKLSILEGIGWEFTSENQVIWMSLVPFAQWMSSANSCINPFLYNFLDPNFRSRFRQMLRLSFTGRISAVAP